MLMDGIVLLFFQAEYGIRDLVRSRGLGDVYKRQATDGVPDRLTFVALFKNKPSLLME